MQSIRAENIAQPFPAFSDRPAMDASFLPVELFALHGVLRRALPQGRGKIVEVGTHYGVGVVQYRRMFPEVKIFSINALEKQMESVPPQGELLPAETIGYVAREQGIEYEQVLESSLRYDFSQQRPYHAVIIDGDHRYADLDTFATVPWIQEGGVVVWHDYTSESPIGRRVKKAVDRMDEKNFGGEITCIEGTWLAFAQIN